MRQIINWGIIGLGNVAQTFSEGFKNINNARLLAISSLNTKKLEQFNSIVEKISDKYDIKVYDLSERYSTMPIFHDLHHVVIGPQGQIYSDDVAKIILDGLE